MAERFNGRIQRAVLRITIDSHHDLEGLLRGFNQAYNARQQGVLGGLSPDQVVAMRLGSAQARQPNLQVAEPVLGHQGPGRRPPRQGGLTSG